MNIKSSFLIFLLVLFICKDGLAKADAQFPVIVLTDKNENYPIGKTIFLYEDKTGELDIHQIRNLKNRFTQSTQTAPSFGFTTTVVWSYFTVRNTSDKAWYLEIGSSYEYTIDLYSEDQHGQIEHSETGLQLPYEARPVRVNLFMLPLHVEKGETKTFYMRLESQTVVNFPIRIATIQKLYETNHIDDIVNGLCFGLIIALSLYNLFVFFSLRDITYLYYVMYILSFMVALSFIKGYFQAIVPYNFNLNHSTYPSATVFIFMVLFTNSFLFTKKYLPGLTQLSYVFYSLSGASIIFTSLGWHLIGFNLIMLQVFLIIPYVILMCSYALKKGFKPARFYLAGFSFFTVGVLIYVLKDHGILPHNQFTVYSMQLGSAIEAVVLSFALADKLNIYKKEKEESQSVTLTQSNEFSRKLIKLQEDERRRIATELHDSIGQSLSIIKNKITLLKKNDPRIEVIDGINEIVSETIQTVRSMSYRLRPFQLEMLGLRSSLKSLMEEVSDQSDIGIKINIDQIDGVFSKESEINIYRIVQGYLNVLSKTTNTREATVSITKQGSYVHISFQDDGSVLQAIQDEKTFPVSGIIKRIKILGGYFRIVENKSHPPIILIEIPIPVQIFG